jgi:hypothetical protein
MANIKPRRSRPTSVRFPSTGAGVVECPICTKTLQAQAPRPKRATARYGVPRKFFVQHMKQVHSMSVVPPEAVPQEIIPPRRSFLDKVRSLFVPQG